MYSYEDRKKAVELYIKYDRSAASTVRELGYPDRKMLAHWYKEYIETGELHERSRKKSKFTEEQMRVAVHYYLEHGKNIARTVRKIGYPSRETLRLD